LERILERSGRGLLKHYSDTQTIRVADVSTEIRSEYLLDTCIWRYRFVNLLGRGISEYATQHSGPCGQRELDSAFNSGLGFLVVRVSGYRSRGPGSREVVGLKRGPLSLVRITEELLERKVAVPV
jgi:hypothetical protein